MRSAAVLRCVRISPDGQWIAGGDEEGAVWIWPFNMELEPIRIAAHRGRVNCLLWDDDSRTLISGGVDGRVKFLIRELPQERFTLHTGAPVQSLARSSDGRSFAIGDNAGSVRLYRATGPDDVLDVARKGWREASQDPDRARDLLLTLWASYLERKNAGDPNAKQLLQEAIDMGGTLPEALRKALTPWLEAFATELKKAARES